MNNENKDEECSCWRVELPGRAPDFAAARACGSHADCRARRRVRATLVGLTLCVVVGILAGLYFARSEDSENLASLRRLYLERVSSGGRRTMKRLLLLGLIGGTLALIALTFSRRRFCDCELAHSAKCGDTGCWFRCEFGLDAKTCAAIAASQDEFQCECERHCREVNEAAAALKGLPADAGVEVRGAAIQTLADADLLCRKAREAHVRRVAALMPAEARSRYLEIVLPRLEFHDHHRVPDASGR